MNSIKMAAKVLPILSPGALGMLREDPVMADTLLGATSDVGLVRDTIEKLASLGAVTAKARSLGRPSLGALVDPVGKPWDTALYESCMSQAIVALGPAPADKNSAGYAIWMGALEAAQQNCINKAKAALGQPAQSSAAITAAQNRINALLKANGYCPNVGVDGKLGKQTCGAAMWAASVDPSFSIPGGCANPSTLPGNPFVLQSPPCPGGGGGAPPVHTCPTGQHWDDAKAACVPDASTVTVNTGSSAWPILAGIVAGLGALLLWSESQKPKKGRHTAAAAA